MEQLKQFLYTLGVPRKNKKSNKTMAEFIFWLHSAVLVAIVLLGLFVAWYWVVLVLVIIKLQQKIFHGCILTIWEMRERRFKHGTSCFYISFKRFFGIKLTKRGVVFVSAMHNLLALMVALLAGILNIRLHL
jgi:hypothetical protein